MIYFDTSYLVRVYIEDSHSTRIHELLAGGETIACALHGKAELYSAFHRAFREKIFSSPKIRILMEQIKIDTEQQYLRWLPLTDITIELTERAYQKATRDSFLRAADALHLSTARENGFKVIYSNDQRLLASAPLFNLKGKNII